MIDEMARQVDADQHVGEMRAAAASTSTGTTSPTVAAEACREASAAATQRHDHLPELQRAGAVAAARQARAAAGPAAWKRCSAARRSPAIAREALWLWLADGHAQRLHAQPWRQAPSQIGDAPGHQAAVRRCSTTRWPAWVCRRPNACWRCWPREARRTRSAGRRHGRGVRIADRITGDGQRRGDRQRCASGDPRDRDVQTAYSGEGHLACCRSPTSTPTTAKRHPARRQPGAAAAPRLGLLAATAWARRR